MAKRVNVERVTRWEGREGKNDDTHENRKTHTKAIRKECQRDKNGWTEKETTQEKAIRSE